MNSELKKFVIDTNVLISAAIYPQSLAAQTLTAAFAMGDVCRSAETLQELQTVLNRSKFDRYFVDKVFTRAMFVSIFEKYAIEVTVTHACIDCTDPKDNMFCYWRCQQMQMPLFPETKHTCCRCILITALIFYL
jgi:putative PIN family toxin of toxin-antitoxin system